MLSLTTPVLKRDSERHQKFWVKYSIELLFSQKEFLVIFYLEKFSRNHQKDLHVSYSNFNQKGYLFDLGSYIKVNMTYIQSEEDKNSALNGLYLNGDNKAEFEVNILQQKH